MRWIVISLILVNVMFLGWRHVANSGEKPMPEVVEGVEPVAQPEPQSAQRLAAQTITLLEELEQKTLTPPAPQSQTSDAKEIVERDPVEVASDAEPVADLSAGGPSIGNPSIGDVPVDGSPTQTSEKDDALLPRQSISLAEGKPSTLVIDDEESEQGINDEQVSSVIPESCYWVGPLQDEVERETYIKRLTDLKMEVAVEVVPASGGWRYWVYLPPEPSKDAAENSLAVLKNLGIDSYLIYQGEKANGISLGLFSRKDLAEAKFADIKKRGFNVAMDSYERQVSESWLVIKKRFIDNLGEGVLPRMFKNKSDLEINQKKCELAVASGTDIH